MGIMLTSHCRTIACGTGFLCFVMAMLCSCSAGAHHSADASLVSMFLQHEKEFEDLLTDVRADSKLEMISIRDVRYSGRSVFNVKSASDVEAVGLSSERWRSYMSQLNSLGIVQVNQGGKGVTLTVDEPSFLNGDSSKGYQYSLEGLSPLQTSLDAYQISAEDKKSTGGYSVFKALKGNWYIFLYVN